MTSNERLVEIDRKYNLSNVGRFGSRAFIVNVEMNDLQFLFSRITMAREALAVLEMQVGLSRQTLKNASQEKCIAQIEFIDDIIQKMLARLEEE